MYTVVDVSSSVSVASWIKSTKEKYGRLDGAVNMAGVIRKARPITMVTDEEWETTFAVNSEGIFNCLRAQISAIEPGGSIVSGTTN